MTRDEAKRVAEWAAAHDAALTEFQSRVKRKQIIIAAFTSHRKPTCSISVKHEAFDNYGNPRTFDMTVPARMAQEWLMIDIANQIDAARAKALRAGVSPELLVEKTS